MDNLIPFLQAYAVSFLAVLAYMAAIWVFSLIKNDASIVDIFWGLGFVFLAWYHFITSDGFLGRQLLLLVMVTLWGLRLTTHIFRRNWGKPEDYRYQEMRAKKGKDFWWYSFFQVYLFQGVIMWLVSAPIAVAQFSPTPDRLASL
ncbi:MAG: DUF1295 domain-containing protein, partial [Chloroflexi bacterium]|nr:DUF1295 domain-containing protein [Chloroflexota bacterium]